MSNENEIVLDPFLGSGSTCIAALKHNRKVIGFEISEEYCELAAQRIGDYLNEDQMSFTNWNTML